MIILKRIYLYDKNEKLVFSGSLCDLPLDNEKVRAEAKRLYGDRVCTDRIRAVKTRFISQITSGDGVIDGAGIDLLEDKNVCRFVIDDD